MIVGGLDTETTGLFSLEHRIIEACIKRYEWSGVPEDPHTLIDSVTWRINPERSIDAKAREVHGISESDLLAEPKWAAVAPLISARMDSCDVVVAHNGLSFDFPFLLQEFKRVGVDDPDVIPFDTMVDGTWATPFGKSPTLAELCWASGVPYDATEAHAADYDVEVMMKCFFHGIKRKVFSL